MNLIKPSPNLVVVHNYGAEPKIGLDTVVGRIEDLYAKIEDRVRIRSVQHLARGTLPGLGIREGDELFFGGGSVAQLDNDPALKAEVLGYLRIFGGVAVGVCFGSQALGRAHGGELTQMPEKRLGPNEIEVVRDLGGFAISDTFTGYESHSWSFADLPGVDLGVYAMSPDGVEVFVHETLPVAGTQFHPEIDDKGQRPEAVAAFAAAREIALSQADK